VDSKQRKQIVALAALGVVLVALVMYQFGSGAPASKPTTTRTRGASQARADGTTSSGSGARRNTAAAAVDPKALEIDLARLEDVAPEPAEASRDPFRFRPAAAPPREQGSAGRPMPGGPTVAPPVVVPTEPAGPPVAPPPPPISLKFIGVLSQAEAGRIAVLSDGKFVYHGREGEIIEGRYRVVKIGEESIQMEYVDGRGRQTIRLTGS